jgi:hypothetical protein
MQEAVDQAIEQLEKSQMKGMYQDQRMAHVWLALRILKQAKEKLNEIPKQDTN